MSNVFYFTGYPLEQKNVLVFFVIALIYFYRNFFVVFADERVDRAGRGRRSPSTTQAA
jgi:hypothetical protein